MNITDVTPQQLRRAASIKEELDSLNKELRKLLNGVSSNVTASAKKRRAVSAAVKRKIAAAQRRDGRSVNELSRNWF
jgi:hypothetical protein